MYYYWKNFQEENKNEKGIINSATSSLLNLIQGRKNSGDAKIFEEILNSIWSSGKPVIVND